MPVCIAFFVFLKDLGVQSMMCTQLEPNIAREISDCLDERRGQNSLHQESCKEYHGSYSTDVKNVFREYFIGRGSSSERRIICAGNE